MAMMHTPLLMSNILDRGARVAPKEEIVTATESGVRRQTYKETRDRAHQLAHALANAGIDIGDRFVEMIVTESFLVRQATGKLHVGVVVRAEDVSLDDGSVLEPKGQQQARVEAAGETQRQGAPGRDPGMNQGRAGAGKSIPLAVGLGDFGRPGVLGNVQVLPGAEGMAAGSQPLDVSGQARCRELVEGEPVRAEGLEVDRHAAAQSRQPVEARRKGDAVGQARQVERTHAQAVGKGFHLAGAPSQRDEVAVEAGDLRRGLAEQRTPGVGIKKGAVVVVPLDAEPDDGPRTLLWQNADVACLGQSAGSDVVGPTFPAA